MGHLPTVPLPQRIYVTDEEGTRRLSPSQETGVWGEGAVTVSLQGEANTLTLYAPGVAVRQVRLHWASGVVEGARLLGDTWERGYGDLEWRGLIPERRMPWYFLGTDGGTTFGSGVATGANAFCWWQADSEGISLFLDVSSGGRCVLLGERTLEMAALRSFVARPDQTPFEAAREFCQLLCPAPRLPALPVFGANDWYYAYGRNTAEVILQDTERLIALCPSGENRPFSVIDDGWQPNRLSHPWALTQQGPWDQGNDNFPDMPGLAHAIRERGARPGIWIRPLGAPPGTPENRLLPETRSSTGANGGVPSLDPSIPENLAQIHDDMHRLRGWGYELIKHDWTTSDILGLWGFEMGEKFTNSGWQFADQSRTTAEIIRTLYQTIRKGAGDALLIGCNTVGHLGAGLFELQRTGDDTSGKEWERTRKMGINTLAFRMPQHNTFFAADADCVGLTREVPWGLNRQWLDLLARSGTPLFVSAQEDAVGPEQAAALKEAFARAAQPQPPAEPLDWMQTTCPRRWRFGAETVTYHWHEENIEP